MKRIVIAALMFTITSCAVESAPPEPSSTPAADEADFDNAELSRSTPDRGADPNAINCPDICESRAQCLADHGIAHGACIITGTICCEDPVFE